MSDLPLIVIVGPTASGKTLLATRLAKQFSGEIISADSRATYRDLDIGTAKPSLEERESIPHWGVDIVGPGERFTVVDFQTYALRTIDEIRARGNIPFLVGGTGLYVDSIVYMYQFPELAIDANLRLQLESQSIEDLWKYCTENNIKLPENAHNKRYVVNNILRRGIIPNCNRTPAPHTIIVGITTENEQLRRQITKRARAMWRSGLVEEALRGSEQYGWNSVAMSGNAYRVVKEYSEGLCDEMTAIQRIATRDMQLAKRQRTWLRRNKHIMWLECDEAYTYIAQILAACLKS